MPPSSSAPRRVAIVGAGMVGLSTAWFLQEHGVDVVVLDRRNVASGSSWGNAGWLTPAMATPLPEPSVLAYGLRGMLDQSSAVYIPLASRPHTWRFLAQFARHCRHRIWSRSMAALRPLHLDCMDAYERVAKDLTPGDLMAADVLCAFASAGEAEAMRSEMRAIADTGLPVSVRVLDGDQARQAEPALSASITGGLQIHAQHYIEPGRFAAHLAEAIVARGGVIMPDTEVRSVSAAAGRTVIHSRGGEDLDFDATVIATGAWLPKLARQHGVRALVEAGRGYSFSVRTDVMPLGPAYFPGVRVACTPFSDRMRVAGTMEFRDVDAPLDPRRIEAIIDSVRGYLNGVNWSSRSEDWVGGRPVTSDGLPLIGATKTDRVYVAGGHGMWGVTLGPVSGQLLAEQIVTGVAPAGLAPFSPTR